MDERRRRNDKNVWELRRRELARVKMESEIRRRRECRSIHQKRSGKNARGKYRRD